MKFAPESDFVERLTRPGDQKIFILNSCTFLSEERYRQSQRKATLKRNYSSLHFRFALPGLSHAVYQLNA